MKRITGNGRILVFLLLLDGIEAGDGGIVHMIPQALKLIQIQQEILAAQPVGD